MLANGRVWKHFRWLHSSWEACGASSTRASSQVHVSVRHHAHFNPLWGHCQEYKIDKNATSTRATLSEKRSTFADYNLTLLESFCLTPHEKQIQKVVARWKICRQEQCLQEQCVNSAKAKKYLASCVASEVLWVTDKLSSFPSKAEFSQIDK